MRIRNHDSQKETPKLIELFDIIRDPKNLLTLSTTEQTSTQLFTDTKSIDDARNEIDDAWNTIFDYKEFLSHLKTPTKPESRKYLKKVRKFGVMRKFSYLHLTKKQNAPETFHLLIKKLGEMNDALDAETDYKKISEQVAVLAQKQVQIVEPQLQSIEPSQLRQNILTMIQEILKTIQFDTLPVHVFHDVRKDIRNLMNFFQLETIHSLGSPTHRLFIELFELSHDLGQEHDVAVHKDLQAKQKYESQVQEITPELRNRIHNTLSKVVATLIPEKPSPSPAQAIAHRAPLDDDWTSVHTS